MFDLAASEISIPAGMSAIEATNAFVAAAVISGASRGNSTNFSCKKDGDNVALLLYVFANEKYFVIAA